MVNQSRTVRGVSRRVFVAALAGGLGATFAGPVSRAEAAASSPSPTLPGEYTRASNVSTPIKGTLYDNICVKIKGDAARLFVPQTIKPHTGLPVRVVWLYHGAGSDHNALTGGFLEDGQRIVDEGAIAICQDDGGTLWSSPTAQNLQISGYSYMSSLYTITANILRATSGGGALACETYGSKLIPNIAGMYNVNAVYDLMSIYNLGGEQKDAITAVFGDDPAAIQASNPARLPQSAWAGDDIRIVVSTPSSSDQEVPPDQNGLALLDLASPVAAEASLRTHTNGHNTPGFAHVDFIAALQRWAPGDSTPPTVAVTSPSSGAVLTSSTNLTATASDASGVSGVTFSVGSTAIAGTLSGGNWIATFDPTTVSNGSYSVTATATDTWGNTATSAAVSVTVQTVDTAPPTVSITSPSSGAVLGKSVQLAATAADNTAVTSVYFKIGTSATKLPATQSGDTWTTTYDASGLKNGTYSLYAVAADAAGNTTTSAPVSVSVKNGDITPPTVSVTAPSSGTVVSSTTTLTATATDDNYVNSVSFTVGSTVLAGTNTGSSWAASFDTSKVTNGSYSVTATAVDGSGNSSTSAAVSFTVKNSDVTAPTATVTSPTKGAVLSGVATATAVAADNVGVTAVAFYAGLKLVGPATLSNGVWSLTFNTATSATPNSTFNLTARATDAAGNVGTSAPVSVTIKN